MSFLGRIFPWLKPAIPEPGVAFGRYSDAYKTEAQQAAWNRALLLFEEKRPLDAYREMLVFMRDDVADNVRWQESEKGIQFEFLQGSRRITGWADRDQVRVESRIAWADDLNVGFMRRLMEHNFRLRYARFALSPDNCLSIVFDSHTKDGSPYKLLQAFRELSINADKQDDLLVEEFRTLRRVEDEELRMPLPDGEKKIKIAYLRQALEAVFAALQQAQPDPNRFPGGYVYLMLGTAFRIDYLVRPEGVLMDTLEKVYQVYFAKDDRTPAAKVEQMRRLFQKCLERTDEQMAAELYHTRSTFGITPAVGHDRVQALIETELPKMDWHIEQNHPEIISMAIAKYMVGYGLYHYTPPPPDRAFFHLFFQITEAPFFKDLGYDADFWLPGGQLKKEAVLEAIRAIARQWRPQYPQLKPETQYLQFSSLPVFAKSYLNMVKNIQLTTISA